jgi:hypothetical protein
LNKVEDVADAAGRKEDDIPTGPIAGKVDDVAGAAGRKVDDAAGTAVRSGDDIARAGETLLDRGRRILGDMPLNTGSLNTLYQAGKLTMDEARALAKSVAWKDDTGKWIYPPDNGFHVPGVKTQIKKDQQLVMDRYGHPGGGFTSPLGESIPGRALPPGTDFSPGNYHIYRVVDDIDVLAGRATPWFDQIGGAVQYKLPDSIKELVRLEKLEEISNR